MGSPCCTVEKKLYWGNNNEKIKNKIEFRLVRKIRERKNKTNILRTEIE